MSIKSLHILKFIELAQDFPVIDVRSPSEYRHANIPGSINIPLFSDDERAEVGTIYKQECRENAIKRGLEFFGLRMREIIEQTEVICNSKNNPSEKKILVHCWRGGMRSSGIAWLLDLYGFEVYTLHGGYKAFRSWVIAQFEKEYRINIIGGYTGSGKTGILKEMEKNGHAVIDLEGLACHKGSAFGNIGMPEQPSQEMFENLLAISLYSKSNTDPLIWIEDESQRIGTVNLPLKFWSKMNHFPIFFLDIPFEERLENIIKEYGKLDREKLVNAIIRIKKRLGGLETKLAINFLIEDNIKESFKILLKYYDKSYIKSLDKKNNVANSMEVIPCKKVDKTENMNRLIQFSGTV